MSDATPEARKVDAGLTVLYGTVRRAFCGLGNHRPGPRTWGGPAVGYYTECLDCRMDPTQWLEDAWEASWGGVGQVVAAMAAMMDSEDR